MDQAEGRTSPGQSSGPRPEAPHGGDLAALVAEWYRRARAEAERREREKRHAAGSPQPSGPGFRS